MQDKVIVISPVLAKKLLRKKYKIADLNANKYNRKLSVFVFKKEDGIDKLIENYRAEIKEKNKQRSLINDLLS